MKGLQEDEIGFSSSAARTQAYLVLKPTGCPTDVILSASRSAPKHCPLTFHPITSSLMSDFR
jgi:hypothetical protein